MDAIKYTINDRKVDYYEWLSSTEAGLYKAYYNNGVLQVQTSLHEGGARHGTELLYNGNGTLQNARVFFEGTFIGDFEDLLKEKGKLWFLIVFGEAPKLEVAK